MQQQKWMREHGEWQKPRYGTAAVKEDYKYAHHIEDSQINLGSRNKKRNTPHSKYFQIFYNSVSFPHFTKILNDFMRNVFTQNYF